MDFEVKVIERNFMIRVHYSGGFKAENVLYVSVRRGYGKVSQEGVLFPLSSLKSDDGNLFGGRVYLAVVVSFYFCFQCLLCLLNRSYLLSGTVSNDPHPVEER